MAGDRIALGILRKAHGVRGEASVEAWSDSPDRFIDLPAVTLVSPDESETREVAIESVRIHAGRALVKFSGIDAPEDLRTLQNWTLEVPLAQARALESGEYFLHDLVGLTLVDGDGRTRGVVTGTEEGGGGLLLNVERDGHRFDVPFAAGIVTKIDLAAKRALVDLPVGLDDLDAVAD
ncbi:MAG: rRNA processing protein RimM [Thermoanaerobaculia bacterium]|jgi:16S rRNA processing protein RimM|nr:rRNA processing protein RimM [Thermoanaerobaculia bacterium]